MFAIIHIIITIAIVHVVRDFNYDHKITEEKCVGQSEERASTFKGQIERKKPEKKRQHGRTGLRKK